MRAGISAVLCALMLLVFPWLSVSAGEVPDADAIRECAEGIISWKKADIGEGADEFLLCDSFLELAGTTPGDWFPIGLGRLEIPDAYDAYLAVIRERVEERYRKKGKLSASKATEWHRISLAVLACGGDPTSLGTDEDGNPINLIADGTYDRGKTASLGRQGINGWIWGLIALDSRDYPVPEGAFDTRESILVEILRRQLSDGGFALSGQAADPDITAMALQALSPYYNDETLYTYVQDGTKEQRTVTVRQIVDEALACLSRLQLDTGGFSSWGTQNVESADQVVVALCSLGMDPLTDSRFIKNGNTLWDAILTYRMPDGGFLHAASYDPDNPTSLPDRSNTMASEQTLYTMAALWRQKKGMRRLYDFRGEMSPEMKERATSLQAEISALDGSEEPAVLTELLNRFYALPKSERSYVRGYWNLSDAARAAGLDIAEIAGRVEVVEEKPDEDRGGVLLYFSASDRAAVDALPQELTTANYITVITLLDKLENAEDFAEKEEYRAKLTAAKGQIAVIQAEIDAINREIADRLYPFEEMSLSDKKAVDDLVARYEALSEADREQIRYYEDVLKTKTKIDNALRAVVIWCFSAVAAAVLLFALIYRVRGRRLRKQREMDELAARYDEENR